MIPIGMANGARKQLPENGPQSAATIPAPSLRSDVKMLDLTAPPRVDLAILPDDEPIGVLSSRPTTVPDYDVEALAAASSWEAQLPQGPSSELPIDLAVPLRKRASVDGAPLRAAFLLSHVDDRATVTEIATVAQIPLENAIESFMLLEDLGLVELRRAGPSRAPAAPAEAKPSRPPTPRSGLRPKT